jgi:hypothetical protein
MKNRDKWRGLRARDVKVYPCRVLVEGGQPVERVINTTTAIAISRENRKQAKEIVKVRPKGPSKTPRAWLSGMPQARTRRDRDADMRGAQGADSSRVYRP